MTLKKGVKFVGQILTTDLSEEGNTDADSPVFPCVPEALLDPKCFMTGPASFGHRRSGGARKHAGIDIYLKDGEDHSIFAIESGIVLRSALFYNDTYAIEIEGETGIIYRYCELIPANGITVGTTVEAGDCIGTAARVLTHLPVMLHLEMYTGITSGPLTVRDNEPYSRRTDLRDPTMFVMYLQNKARGTKF